MLGRPILNRQTNKQDDAQHHLNFPILTHSSVTTTFRVSANKMSGSLIGHIFRDPDSLARLHGATGEMWAIVKHFKDIITERGEELPVPEIPSPSQPITVPQSPIVQHPAPEPSHQTWETLPAQHLYPKTPDCSICFEKLAVESFPRVTRSCFDRPDVCPSCLRDWIEATLNGLN